MNMPRAAILVLIGLGPFACAAHIESSSPRLLPPVIESATLNFNDKVMIIRGRNFGGAPPTVRLADHVLTVRSFSANKIIVSLPPGIRPAARDLRVTTYGPHNI